MHKVKPLPAVCAVLLLWCASPGEGLYGRWISQSVTHPSPFFKNALSNKKPGVVELTLRPDGTFTWRDYADNLDLAGTCSAEKNVLTLTDPRERETVRVKYALKKPGLVIETPDGFVFSFRKEGK